MKVTVVGCGEAFDEAYPNTSLLVEHGGKVILLDCGYSVPRALWTTVTDANAIDLIWVSHGHADHYFGLPAVLGRMWEDGRTKPLKILSQPPVLELIRNTMEAAYAGLSSRFQYAIEYVEAVPARPFTLNSLRFAFAPTRHAVTNLAVRIDSDAGSVCYSGDGLHTDESRALFRRAGLLIHEAYSFDQLPVHGDIPGVLQLGADAEVTQIALVHLQRTVRRDPSRVVEAMKAARIPASMPEPGVVFTL